MQRDLNTLKDCVEGWAKDKGIWGGDFLPQFQKFSEEVEELKDELVDVTITRGKTNSNGFIPIDFECTQKEDRDQEAMEMEFGDVLVTLIILASKLDTTVERCLGMAYDKISKRTGKVIDGTFVKSEDLPE